MKALFGIIGVFILGSFVIDLFSESESYNYSAQAVSSGSNCHPSYSGCLNPNASDYDCAGGSGNGPYYTGKVRVVGPDVYGLDRDHDGWGCE